MVIPMTIVQINAVCGTGSTGKICVAVSELLTQRGIENYILYSAGESAYPLGIRFANNWHRRLQTLKARLFGNPGFNSRLITRNLIRELERLQPDIVHLHNIHENDCNLPMLFRYLKEKRIRLFWTFHDCWAFTGGCMYFSTSGCEKWKSGCGHCPSRKDFSWFFDRSRQIYARKKALFSGLDLTIVTPSQWMADLVKESFLKDYPVQVIRNGIDLSVFKPTPSDFRTKHGIDTPGGVFLILGAAYDWGFYKGLDVFVELARRLDPERFRIALVGTDGRIDRTLPAGILSIHRTRDQRELAEIYTAADLLLNASREETYPTVNMEALACGTPVLTFRTGGSPETIDGSCGAVVEREDVDALEAEILRLAAGRPYPAENCLRRAERFAADAQFERYADLYTKAEDKG